MLNQSGIYEILNTVNGKRYIGSAKKLKSRWSTHFSALRLGKHANKHLQAAWNKYGETAFKFLPILTCAKSMLLFYEQQLLDKVHPEYNIAPTAGNTLGIPCSDDKRKKLSKAHTGKVLTDEHKAAIAEGGRGRTPTNETREKLSKSIKARIAADPTFSQRSAETQRNRVWTDESREKLSKSRRGKPNPKFPEGRERQRQAVIKYNQTRVVSEKTREKMSKKTQGRKMSKKALALQTERMKGNSYRKGIPWTPEMREKIMATKAAKRAAKEAQVTT